MCVHDLMFARLADIDITIYILYSELHNIICLFFTIYYKPSDRWTILKGFDVDDLTKFDDKLKYI